MQLYDGKNLLKTPAGKDGMLRKFHYMFMQKSTETYDYIKIVAPSY